MKIRANLRTYLSIIISVVSLAWVVWWASKQETPEFPTDLNHILWIVAAIGMYGLATIARSWRWSRLLDYARIKHSRADIYALIPITYMANTVLPARGGDVLRVLLLHDRVRARRRDILATVVTERALDALSLAVMFVVITIIGVAKQPFGVEPALFTALALAVLAAGGVLFIALLRRGLFARLANLLSPLITSIRPLVGLPGITMSAATVVIWLLEGLLLWFVGLSLSLKFGIVEGFFLLIIAAFSSLIPAGPGFIGTFDAALVFGLRALSVTGEQASGFVLLARFVLFFPITVVGIVLLVLRFGGLKQLRRQKERVPIGVAEQTDSADRVALESV